jgi:hypothetical protein
VNRLVAQCAGLVFGRLIVSRAGGTLHGKRVTLQAQQVHLTYAQQARIGRAMRRVAARATLRLDRYMFVDKWPLFIRVAFKTDSVSLRQSANLAQRRRSMDVVAVTALNQSLINAMMMWLRKVRFRRDVAPKAKSRLRVNQQMFRFCRVVGRMTVQTAHIVTGVHGTAEVALLVILTVAAQASSIRVLLG